MWSIFRKQYLNLFTWYYRRYQALFFYIYKVEEGPEERISAMEELNSKLTFFKVISCVCVCQNVSCVSSVTQNTLFVCS